MQKARSMKYQRCLSHAEDAEYAEKILKAFIRRWPQMTAEKHIWN